MAKDKKLQVIEHNDLITSMVKADTTSLKLFEMIVAHIDVKNPPKDRKVTLSKKSIYELFNINSRSWSDWLNRSLKKLKYQTMFLIIQPEANGNIKYKELVAIISTTWETKSDDIGFELHEEMLPYIANLKQNFTKYALADVLKLNSKYSIALYRTLCMRFNQYKNYVGTDKRTEEQLYQYKNPTIQLKKIRMYTNTEKKYLDFRNFKKRVLDNAVEDINTNTHFSVTYKKIKKSYSVDSIQFFITEKIDRSDLAPISSDVLKKKNEKLQLSKSEIYAKAMQSNYTQMLGKHFLLGFADTSNIDLMVSLESYVYPQYDVLKKFAGENGVDQHISYVANHTSTSEIPKIDKYLEKSIKQYLTRYQTESAYRQLD